ncbi:MAG TPA: SBBP repeat-containing protein [Chthoniobacterales bacterium]|nr:SBBP repeat-containing protein [Chthoniobacterales bacterium]
MKSNLSSLKAVVLALLIVSTVSAVLIVNPVTPPQTAPRTAAQAREAYGKLPLSFEENRGQANESVDFVARGPGYALALAPTEAAFSLSKLSSDSAKNAAPSTVLRMNLVGANGAAKAAGQNELEGRVNYFIGNDPSKWRTEVPTFERVRYAEVYPGIDVVYYGNQRRLEYDFVVGPGQDSRAIALEFAGTDKVEVEGATGDLLIAVGGENLRQHKPIAYQEISGARREIESRYVVRNGARVGFEVGQYDASAALIIDPVLEYSTFLGGSGSVPLSEQATSIVVDSSGRAYVAGLTNSTDFPIANAIQSTVRGIDVFIAKFNAAGSALVYSTYLGGSGFDFGYGIAVDSGGSVYVTGTTTSTNFPIANALQSMNGSSGNFPEDAFVTKLSATGSALIYSTYLGGSDDDQGAGIAVDSGGNAYVTGTTHSTNFPTANAIQSTSGGGHDAFVAKFNATGSALIYSTYLGGNSEDVVYGIAVDGAGSAYVTGYTSSANFPTVNAFQNKIAGGSNSYSDVFVTKFNAAGSALVYSTYLGGDGEDVGASIAVDSTGSAYLTGYTIATNFPTANAFKSALSGFDDAFVTKFNSAGSALIYSTYLGGDASENGAGIAVDLAGNAYVTGFTDSTDFPTVNPLQSPGDPVSDAFVTKLNPAGTALVYSTYLGGNGGDSGHAIAVDSAGSAYVTGETFSRCFPTTIGAFDTRLAMGDSDAFITKISETAQPVGLNPCPSDLLNLSTRLGVLPGNGALIAGFIITGNDLKRVIIRGLGPSLSSNGVQGALADPTLDLFDSNQRLIVSNDDWITNRAEVEATGIPPTNDRESAIVVELSSGAYTAVLRGQNNGTGIGVVEVYDLEGSDPSNTRMANLGSRGFVGTGDNVMIGGFIIGGSGQGDTRVVVRGIGPSLGAFGVTAALQDPIIDLKNANGTTLMTNDDWQQGQPTEITALGLAPSDSRESALLTSLPQGNFTVILRGKGGATGVGVVEFYNVP